MRLDINGCEWEIKECCNNNVPLCEDSFYGRTFYFDKVIFINRDIKKDQKEKTLRHELVHAFLDETQITTQEKGRQFSEEEMCEFMAHYGQQICDICIEYFNEV